MAKRDHTFLRQTPLFRSLSDQALKAIHDAGELMVCSAGRVIFTEGTPGYDLFVVWSGVVEVLKSSNDGEAPRVVSYLSTGDCVGEMSVITGLLRSATVRVPGQAEIFRIPGAVFDRLLHESSEVALSLARTLAYRLEIANQVQISPSSASSKHLTGDLEVFDLAELCQTLAQGRRTGLMRLKVDGGPEEIWLYVEDGLIRYARLGALVGRDAALTIFRKELKGSFEFESAADFVVGPQEPAVDEAPMSLLLEAARQRDEIEALLEHLPGDDHVFSHRLELPFTELLPPSDKKSIDRWVPARPEDLEFARAVWAAIAAHLSLSMLRQQWLAKEHELIKLLRTLLALGAIR